MAGFLFSEQAARKIVADHEALGRLYRNLSREVAAQRATTIAPRPSRQRFLNNSGEECPAYAVMEVTAGVRGGANAYTEERLTITKPTSTFNRLYLVNGGLPVADQKEGEGTWLMDDSAGRPVLYASGDGTPAWGESWGAKASQWTLAKNRPGFLVTGANNTTATNPYTSAVQQVVDWLMGQPDADIAALSSGTVSVYMGSANNETDSGINITAYTKAEVAEAKYVKLEWINNAWWAMPWEC